MIASDMEQEQQAMPDLDAALDDDIGDELLRLIFTACHPLLSREARAALALRMICGLTTEEIARAFLLSDAAIAQRIVRAKRTLSESGLAYETPRGEALSERLSSVLEVVYLIFNEAIPRRAANTGCGPSSAMKRFGWAACSPRLRRRSPKPRIACPDGAERLAHRGADRCHGRAHPDTGAEPCALGPIPDPPGNPGARRARELGGAGGFYALQAAIIACHARGVDGCSNRLVADIRPLCRAGGAHTLTDHRTQPRGGRRNGRGPQAALVIVDHLVHEPALKTYHLLGSVRGDLLHKLGRFEEASAAFEAAARLAGNKRERDLLKRRAAEAASAAMSS